MNAYQLVGRWLFAKPLFAMDSDRELYEVEAHHAPRGIGRFLIERSHLLAGLGRLENELGLYFGIGRRWRLNRRLFEAIRDDCARLGIRLLVVYLPSRGERDRRAPGLARAFRSLNVAYLDLQQRQPPDARRLFFRHDPHFNAAGHEFTANEIARALTELGWAEGRRGR